jgi:hypothetical protein
MNGSVGKKEFEMKFDANLNPKAVYGISNTMSVLIYDIEYGINDSVIWRFSNEKKLHKSRIYYRQHDDERAFFSYCGNRFYLDEFIRF